jgi:hypothetical protein
MDPTAISQPGDDAVTREELHFRRIDMRGYRRSDGLFEVVGHLTDHKPANFIPQPGSLFESGKPLHDMGVRLVFDAERVVRDVETFIDFAPFTPCSDGGASLKALVGVRIGSGWSAEIRSRLPRSETCTHLRELLTPMATAAIQTSVGLRPPSTRPLGPDDRPAQIDSCHAYAAHRDVVLTRWPQFHRPRPDGT